MLQINTRNTKTMHEICSGLTIMTQPCLFRTKLDQYSSTFTIDFEKLFF